jgi:16S rRNA (guanine966-N2)-methyltransferase
VSLRIVAGAWGGRRLETPKGEGTRPTADRVREALFSALGDVRGDRVLDLFAGTGALGLEALSRGAAAATFVERDRAALKALRANLSAVGAEANVHAGEALRALENAAARARQYDLVFLDPPYREVARLTGPLPEALAPVLAPGARVVAESDKRVPLRLPFPVTFTRAYGDTLITIHTLP